MYKPEYTLGLIGAIGCTAVAGLLLVITLAVALFAGTAGDIFAVLLHDAGVMPDIVQGVVGMAAGVLTVAVGACFALSTAAAVLGFLGTARLERNDKSGGVLLIVAAGLSLISVCSFVPMVLLLVGGILALSRKPART
jgi:hypothetical protein